MDFMSEIENSLQNIEYMTDGVLYPNLPSVYAKQLRDALRSAFKGWIFRKTQRIITKDGNMEKVVSYFPTSDGKAKYNTYSPREYFNDKAKRKWGPKEHEQNLEFHYSSFYCFTSNRPYPCDINDDPYSGIQIMCHSNSYAEIDMIDFEYRSKKRTVPPRKDDLLCILPVEDNKKRLTAKAWFVCSGQFYHMVNAIMFDDHPSFKGKEELRLKNFLMSGNRLMSNTYMKWVFCHIDNDLYLGEKEMDKLYRRMRTETYSIKWVHVYAALVLMARYEELPCWDNIPNNSSSGPLMKYWKEIHGQEEWPPMKYWSLPPKYIKDILEKWTSFRPEDFEGSWEDIEICVRTETQIKKENQQVLPRTKKDFPPLKKPEEKKPVKEKKPVWKKVVEQVIDDFEYWDPTEGRSWADICC